MAAIRGRPWRRGIAAAAARGATRGCPPRHDRRFRQRHRDRPRASLAEAVRRVADGGTIELAYDGPRREPPLTIADKRVTIIAAGGFRPTIDFGVERAKPEAPPTVACRIDDGRLVIKGVAMRLQDRPAGAGPAAMFGVGTGRVVCEDVVLRMPGDPRGPASGEGGVPTPS